MVDKAVDKKEEAKKAISEFAKKIINYLGYTLSAVGMLGYIVTILVLVGGVPNVELELMGKDGWFFIIGLVFGLWVRTGFYIQGVAYAKQENEDIIKDYHTLKAKKDGEKWTASFELRMTLSVALNTIYQIAMFAVTSIGFVYIAGFEGIKNPIYLASGFSNIIMFTGFGLLALVSTYERYNNLKIPVIKERIRKMGEAA